MRLAEGSLWAVVADRPHRLAPDAERSQSRAGGESLAGGHADEEARHQRAGGGIRASIEACVYPDKAIGGHGIRRTRTVCRAQQSPSTRSRIPSCRRRRQSVTRRVQHCQIWHEVTEMTAAEESDPQGVWDLRA